MPEVKVTILGCGSSGGVPRIGNDWGVCDPENPKNRRSRCGIYVEVQTDAVRPFRILIDTPPELREQLLRSDIRSADCVLFTHTHADQCHGIDDLRVLAYVQRARMPVYASSEALGELNERFAYCFKTPEGSPYPPILDTRPAFTPGKTFFAESSDGRGVPVLPLDQDHGSIRSIGFRIHDFAYCNDVVDLPEETLDRLYGLKLLIVDALRYEPHPTHAHVEKTLSWIRKLKPDRAILTNLHVDLDFETLTRELPVGVEPAYDGMIAIA